MMFVFAVLLLAASVSSLRPRLSARASPSRLLASHDKRFREKLKNHPKLSTMLKDEVYDYGICTGDQTYLPSSCNMILQIR
jgi:hypothetical protein